MNIEDFIGLATPDRYDFSNDGAIDEYNKLDSFIDAYEKFFVYMYEEANSIAAYEEGKAGIMEYGDKYKKECKSKFGTIKDPDSESDLLQKIYKELWTDEKNLMYCLRYCEKKKDNIIQGETMNSVNTTLGKLYEYKSNEKDCIETRKQKDERNSIKPIKYKTQRVSIAYIISRYAEGKSEQEEKYDEIEGLRFFISIYHTLGNFIPVPVGCNRPRGTGVLKDYWDLTLKIIYDYYVCGEDKIRDIVGKAKESKELYERYKNWLDSFEKWECFVEKNYLQDFVNCRVGGGYCMPKELWEGHFFGNPLPTTREQIEQFCANASSWITARSTRMLIKLKKILMEEST